MKNPKTIFQKENLEFLHHPTKKSNILNRNLEANLKHNSKISKKFTGKVTHTNLNSYSKLWISDDPSKSAWNCIYTIRNRHIANISRSTNKRIRAQTKSLDMLQERKGPKAISLMIVQIKTWNCIYAIRKHKTRNESERKLNFQKPKT